MKGTLLFFVVVGLSLHLVSCFKESRIKEVDRYQRQILFRGPAIINHETNEYQFKELLSTLEKLTNTTEHRLTIINLQNFFTAKDTKQRHMEQNFFNQQIGHPERVIVDHKAHFYVHQTILGSIINPSLVPAHLRESVSKYATFFDNIDELLKTIREWLGYNIKGYVYVHCSEGLDRSGYVIGAYKMKYLNATMAQVMKENMELIKQQRNYMKFNSYNGLQWYCLSLGRTDQECLIGKDSNTALEL